MPPSRATGSIPATIPLTTLDGVPGSRTLASAPAGISTSIRAPSPSRRHAERITQAARMGVAAAARTTALLRGAIAPTTPTAATAAGAASPTHASEPAP